MRRIKPISCQSRYNRSARESFPPFFPCRCYCLLFFSIRFVVIFFFAPSLVCLGGPTRTIVPLNLRHKKKEPRMWWRRERTDREMFVNHFKWSEHTSRQAETTKNRRRTKKKELLFFKGRGKRNKDIRPGLFLENWIINSSQVRVRVALVDSSITSAPWERK
jgi:hypothetical protein